MHLAQSLPARLIRKHRAASVTLPSFAARVLVAFLMIAFIGKVVHAQLGRPATLTSNQDQSRQPGGDVLMGSPRTPASLSSEPRRTIQQQIAKKCRGDAFLRDIVALTADRLCAVGDCGTILVTNNAGRTWELKDSKTELDLYAVQFSDPENGVAVGGGLGNYSGLSRAVILQTTDGGATWQPVENDLPCLRGLTQSTSPTPGGRLVAWGDFDPRRNSGMFVSHDQGRSWTSPATPLGPTLATAVLDPSANRLFVVDSEQRIGELDLLDPAKSQVVKDTVAREGTRPQISASELRFVHHTGRRVIACGRGGLLKSSQSGTSWQDIALPLSQQARAMCTFDRISQRGPNVWICGSPGSLLLHSPDFGETWQFIHTSETLPLSKIVFLDERRGWAVGAFGRILATRDGGRSWYRQRGISQAGMLCFASAAESVPWETLAANAWEAQSTTVALLEPDVRSKLAIPASTEQRIRDASSRFGVHLAEQSLSKSENPSGYQSLRVALAVWNPDIVLSPPVQANVLLTMLESKTRASDGVLKELGLREPSIKKVLTPSNREMGQCQESKSRVLNRVGLSALDLLLPLPPNQLADTTPSYFRTVWSATNNTASRSSVHGGVAHNPNSSRSFLKDSLGNYPLVMGRVSRSQLVGELIRTPNKESTWVRDLDFVISQLPFDEQAPALWRLYHAFSAIDANWKREAVLDRMIGSKIHFDATVWAMMARLKSAASAEVQGIILKSKASKSKAAAENSVVVAAAQSSALTTTPWNASPFESSSSNSPSVTGQNNVPKLRPNQLSGENVVPASGIATPAIKSAANTPLDPRLQAIRWFELYGTYSKSEPRLLGLPALRLIEHRLSQVNPVASDGQNAPNANTRLKSLIQLSTLSNWREAAIHELYIQQKMYEKTRRLGLASYSSSPPQLDGTLDEKAWELATPLPLSLAGLTQRSGEATRSSRQPTDVRLRCMHDQNYVYLGVECTSSGQSLPPLSTSRQYDAELDTLDHVQVCFDTNRDYSTAFQLSVAANGETSDQCHDLVDYNPKWYVQIAQHDDQSWTAEIAILKSSAFGDVDMKVSSQSATTSKKGIDGQVWAVSASRFTSGAIRSSTDEAACSQDADRADSLRQQERPFYVLFEPGPPTGVSTPASRTPNPPAALPKNPPQRISSTQSMGSR